MSELDDVLFEAETPLGYSAVLRRRNWERHEVRRPELEGRVANVRSTVSAPDMVIHTTDGCDHFYAMGHGTDALARHYLHVLVREFQFVDGTEHTVVSAWFTRVVEEGVRLWPKEP
jgi:hypothetical protein